MTRGDLMRFGRALPRQPSSHSFSNFKIRNEKRTLTPCTLTPTLSASTAPCLKKRGAGWPKQRAKRCTKGGHASSAQTWTAKQRPHPAPSPFGGERENENGCSSVVPLFSIISRFLAFYNAIAGVLEKCIAQRRYGNLLMIHGQVSHEYYRTIILIWQASKPSQPASMCLRLQHFIEKQVLTP